MVKVITLEVRCCAVCPNVGLSRWLCNVSQTRLGNPRHIPDILAIPKWCPLEEAPNGG